MRKLMVVMGLGCDHEVPSLTSCEVQSSWAATSAVAVESLRTHLLR